MPKADSQGKGHKDRYAMLSPILLVRLRCWWRLGHAQAKILPGGWLFPSMNQMDPVTTRQLNRAILAAAEVAKIDKRVSMPGQETLEIGPLRSLGSRVTSDSFFAVAFQEELKTNSPTDDSS